MKPIIKVQNLSKQYRIGKRYGVYTYASLRESLMEAIRLPFRRLRRNGHGAENMIWALSGLDFEVVPGEVVGIIGHNGAGKSTLLKVLSRITEPTTGRVDLYGRVGSLLEVGTGFHPELSGRENIFLNGSILGMKREEIARKFDEIVAFAEVEKFIDSPVKRYSSGMYVRLAFAVAAFLEPEIMVIDEVLAVGDMAFQKKCLNKMGNIAQEGRTVLFVSHNFEAVKSLCTRSLLLEQGKVIEDNTPEISIEKALARLREGSSTTTFKIQPFRNSSKLPQPVSVKVSADGKSPGEMITFEDDIIATLHLDSPIHEQHTFAFQVMTNTGVTIFNSFYRDDHNNPPLRLGKTQNVSIKIPSMLLPGGVYEAVFAYILPNAEVFWLTRDTWFEVNEINSYRNEGLTVKRTGLISLITSWSNS